MDFNEAIKAHSEWKMKLRHAIASQAQLDAAMIARDDQCALGKWLHGESKNQYGMLASHRECIRHHAAFHRAASNVASTINARDFTNAEAMLARGTEYALTSNAVVIAIGALKREAKL
jgi:methyl-accepting chemotaxis protein